MAPIRPLLTLQCPQIWHGNDAKTSGQFSFFRIFLFSFFFFIAIKAIIIRDSGYAFVQIHGTAGFYESHMQHDRDIIYRLTVANFHPGLVEDIIIFFHVNARYFCDTNHARIKNESRK